MGMTLKKCLFSNIRLECGLRLAPLRMQERNFFVLRFRGGVCVTHDDTRHQRGLQGAAATARPKSATLIMEEGADGPVRMQ